MRLQPYRFVRLTLLAALLCWVASASHAEVSVVPQNAGNDIGSLVMSPATITEDADPIPQTAVRWQMYRAVNSTAALNLNGDDRGDGPPVIAFRQPSNWPVVVWAYNNGSDHDIALSEWAGAGWSNTRFLTSHTDDELDPRMFIRDDGSIVVVWWVNSTDPRVMMIGRSADETVWDIPVRVSPPGEVVRRPSVAVFEGAVRVAYEREPSTDPIGSRELVVRRLENVAFSVEEHVFDIPRTERLDPVLHVSPGRLWVDWKHSNTQFGSSEFVNSQWTTPRLHGWSDSSWVGVEGTRRLVRRTLLAPPGSADLEP